jgi:hypothetical protein
MDTRNETKDPGNDSCTDCSKPKRFTRRWFNKTAVGGALISVGVLSLEKDVIRNAFASDEPISMTPEQLQEWIQTPGLIDSYPVNGLEPELQAQIKQAIHDGDWQYFEGKVKVDPPKAGVAEAACSWYYTYQCVSCCQRYYWHCYQCNGETQFCNGPYSESHNCCAWCGHGPTCCG